MGSVISSRITSDDFSSSDGASRFSEWLLNSDGAVQPPDFCLAMQAIPLLAFYHNTPLPLILPSLSLLSKWHSHLSRCCNTLNFPISCLSASLLKYLSSLVLTTVHSHSTFLCPLPPETLAHPYRCSSLSWVPQTPPKGTQVLPR